ncbi:MAG: ribonuclease P protein component [Candidatus Kerfeldbacteria bacterium]
MLARENRLRSSRDFRRAYENGRAYSTALLTVRTLKRGDRGPTRVGIVVSTKLSKKSVERNAVRRRLREALHRTNIVALRGMDIVVTARPAARSAAYKSLVDECNSYVSRIAKTTHR